MQRRWTRTHPYDAVLAVTMTGMDEAAFVLRQTRGMRAARRGGMRAPRWRFVGKFVTNTVAQDELATELCSIVNPGRRCLFASDVLGPDELAEKLSRRRHQALGRMHGAVESLLAACNCFEAEDHITVTARWTWQQELEPVHASVRPPLTPEQACCTERYGYTPAECPPPMARMVLVTDHLILGRGVWQ
jgi:hypothetical protein